MKKILLAAVAIGAMVTVAAPAQARRGCGAGYHRSQHGHCMPIRRPHRPHRPVVGGYYPGHGYWYNGRYWQHRYRHHGDWRYR